jgi:hypothetical protein
MSVDGKGVHIQTDERRGVHQEADGNQDEASLERVRQDQRARFAALLPGGKRKDDGDTHQKEK